MHMKEAIYEVDVIFWTSMIGWLSRKNFKVVQGCRLCSTMISAVPLEKLGIGNHRDSRARVPRQRSQTTYIEPKQVSTKDI